MGNLESAEGGPGEPPSVSLLPPPGKMPMPEPCELEERFALVLNGLQASCNVIVDLPKIAEHVDKPFH
ncbi:hypothetical protein MC885_020957 [Smutsia gigantea]|nr:hypothetical protein MC885_020957 [Smutsia gigantea]